MLYGSCMAPMSDGIAYSDFASCVMQGTKVVSEVISNLPTEEINKDHIEKLKREINFLETSPEDLFKTKCDIISPCALGGAINALNKSKLQCKSIVGAANNQLEDSTIGEWLNKNNIVYAPDYLVNSGGVIAIASEINKTENLIEKQLKKISKIEAPIAKSKSPVFNFPECPRSGKLVLNIKNLSHSFEDKILFLDINLKISSGEKIAILGPNGCGKSTLLKIIMKKISPEIGEINLGKHNIITSYYEQNQAEALSLDERVIDLICNKSPEWSQKKVRTFLGGFGFQNETVFKYIKQLSGGEKARLALALMIINPSNFLLLDEPTNHLDLQSKENLELAIKNYKGSLLIISHDRYFISKVANRIVEIKDSKLFSYDGNYEYFLEKTQSQKI